MDSSSIPIQSPIKSKICSICKVQKGIEEYPPNKSQKGGFGSWCRSCQLVIQDKAKLGRQMSHTRRLEDARKLNVFLKEFAKVGDGKEAYKVLQEEGVRGSYKQFVDRVGEKFDLVKALNSEMSMKQFDDYFNQAMEAGTLSEKRDAMTLKAKMLGLLKDRTEVRVENTTKEQRDQKIQRIIELRKQDKEMVN